MHSFILAGGFATRLWPLTEKRAKPLLPLAGKPLVTHIIEHIPTGIPVTVSTNAAFGEGFERWASESGNPTITVRVERTKNDDEKIGALGAVAQWVTTEKIEDDVLLLTGDNYFGFPLEDFLARFDGVSPLLAAVDVGDRAKARAFGTVVLGGEDDAGNDRVMTFEEKPAEPKSALVSTGCSILPRAALPILLEFAARHPDNVGGIFEEFLRRGLPVRCAVFRAPWFDIGSFDAYLEATRALVGDRPLLAPDAIVEQCELRGSVVIAPGCTVRGSVLTDTVLFAGCVVENCDLERCILDEHCVLKGIDLQGKMLREGTQLMRD